MIQSGMIDEIGPAFLTFAAEAFSLNISMLYHQAGSCYFGG